MRNGRKFGLLIAVVALVGVMVSPALAASQRVTVGDLYLKIADAKGLRTVDGTTAEAALRQAGFDLPRLDRTKSLTEGDVTSIANAIGVRVGSANPTAAFGQDQVDRFMTSMGSELTTNSGSLNAGGSDSNVVPECHDCRGKRKPASCSPKKPKKPKHPKRPPHHGHGNNGHGGGGHWWWW